MKLKIGFIGTGRLGSALALSLSEKGYIIAALSSRGGDSARKLASMLGGKVVVGGNQEVADYADLIFITTPDDLIGRIAEEVRWEAHHKVVHCSGAFGAEILEPARKMGAEIGAFHPLQTFAHFGMKEAFEGITFAVEAEGELLEILARMAEELGGRWVRLGAEDRVLYHAAAVIACNYLVTLAEAATRLWNLLGEEQSEALEALLPLMRGTLKNLETFGLPHALTGPIARGDVGTIRRHMEELGRKAAELLPLYGILGLHTIPIAERKGGIDEVKAKELKEILKEGVRRW